MDPLSIVVSAGTLVGGCVRVIGCLTTFIRESRRVDDTIQSFCDEVRALANVLNSIQMSFQTLIDTRGNSTNGFGPSAQSEMQHWRDLETSLKDCDETLAQLETIVVALTQTHWNHFDRWMRQVKVNLRNGSMKVLRRQIGCYTQAMHISLLMVNLSINTDSHSTVAEINEKIDMILRTLDNQQSQDVEEAPLQATSDDAEAEIEDSGEEEEAVPPANNTQSDSELLRRDNTVRRHLVQCVRSARTVISGPSSTLVGSGADDEGEFIQPRPQELVARVMNWQTRVADDASTLIGSPELRERNNSDAPESTTTHSTNGGSSPVARRPSGVLPAASESASNIESSTSNRYFSPVDIEIAPDLYKLAQEHFQKSEYMAANKVLQSALERFRYSNWKDFDHKNELMEMQARIYYHLDRTESAEAIVSDLLDSPTSSDDLTENERYGLMHLMSEIKLKQDLPDDARDFCTKAAEGRRKLHGKDDASFVVSITLLAQIEDLLGNNHVASTLRKRHNLDSNSPKPNAGMGALLATIRVGEVMSTLKENGLGVETPRERRKAIDWAVYHGHTDAVRVVLDYAKGVEDEEQTLNEHALHLASENGQEAICQVLLDLGADIDAKNGKGRTPLLTAIHFRNEAIVTLLLHKKADIETRCPLGLTPLMHAVENGSVAIARTLLDHDAYVEAKAGGWTAFHRAADKGYQEMVVLLVSRDADINARSPRVLQLAASSTKEHIRRDSALSIASKSTNGDGWTALHRASDKGNGSMVSLLLDKGAEIEAETPDGLTALFYAVYHGHVGVVKNLLASGANVHATDSENGTPLHRAQYKPKNGTIILQLLEHGAKIDARDDAGKQPLHYAIDRGNEEMVRILLEKNADIKSADNVGRTALHFAASSRNERIVKLLLDKGADVFARNTFGQTAYDVVKKDPFSPVAVQRALKVATKSKKEQISAADRVSGGGGNAEAASVVSAYPLGVKEGKGGGLKGLFRRSVTGSSVSEI